jgi:ribonuclease HI
MESIITFVAGRSHGNPGLAGVGIYITEGDGRLVHQVKQLIGNAKEDFASYCAVALALTELKLVFGDLTRDIHFELRLDNEFVKKHLNYELVITEPGLVPMFIEIHNQRVTNFPDITFTLISPQDNKNADCLAKEAVGGK